MKNVGIVVGGSGGIGSAIIDRLKDDYSLVNMSRNKVESVDNIYMDVNSPQSIVDAFNIIKDTYKHVEFIVYCAGYVEPQGILELDVDILYNTINVNLIGAIVCTQEFVKLSDKKTQSKIVYIASTAGIRAQSGWCAYASAKAGLINFALTMSEELRSFNVKSYCISPGRCATKLRTILAPNEDQSKIMQPEEVADYVKYLITEDNVSDGQNIIVKRV